MIAIDLDSPASPSEQIQQQVALGIRTGELRVGDRLLPIRHLARALGLAAGTVARAYAALEHDGIVQTNGRGGTTITGRVESYPEVLDKATELAELARAAGLAKSELMLAIETGWHITDPIR